MAEPERCEARDAGAPHDFKVYDFGRWAQCRHCGKHVTMDRMRVLQGLPPPEAADHIRPKHYGGPDDPYEPLKVMLAQHGKDAVVNFCWLTAEKYLARAGKKSGEPIARDFRKAAFYLTHAAELLEKP